MRTFLITLATVIALSACQSTEVAKTDKEEKAKKTGSALCKAAPSTGSRLRKRGC
jgi:hypothetical protein